MDIRLSNCRSKWMMKGIDISVANWQMSLDSSLHQYLSIINGWDYGNDTDTMRIDVPDSVAIPGNISDFGDVIV